MDRDSQLALVRTLTREVLEAVEPEKLATFDDEFAAVVITGGLDQAEETAISYPSRERPLDATLVAGMFFRVIMEAERLPVSNPERVAFVRRQAKTYLVTRLSGQISLTQFFRLLHLIEEHVEHYFQRQPQSWLHPLASGEEAAPPAPPEKRVRLEVLRQALRALHLLPKGRRKLTAATLEEFLDHTQGEWFRLLDFENRFGVNKKTAWAYLNQLLHAGILVHNGEKANKVRYTVADRFRG